MSGLRVDCSRKLLHAFGAALPCAIGRGGAVSAEAKREGDGRTPLGSWPLRGALLRPDRLAPPATALPWRWIRPGDGWCDAPADPAYNRPVALPHGASAEALWRADAVYDLILVLGHNDAPPKPGWGSAIFWHVAHADFRATEGCVAIARDALVALLPRLGPGMALDITAG